MKRVVRTRTDPALDTSVDPILVEVSRERAQLEEAIADSQHRIGELDAFVRMYNDFSARHLAPAMPNTADANISLGDRFKSLTLRIETGVPMPVTIKDMVIDRCAKLLSDGRPRHTRDLVDALTIMGVPLRSQDKLLQVSKILSTNPKFVADRSRGWTLAPATKDEGQDGETSEPSDSRPHAA